jgi:hypothetical protein
MESALPEGWKKLDQFTTMVTYESPFYEGVIGTLFETIEAGKAEHGIMDWGLSPTTLDDVFVNLIRVEDATAD